MTHLITLLCITLAISIVVFAINSLLAFKTYITKRKNKRFKLYKEYREFLNKRILIAFIMFILIVLQIIALNLITHF